MAPSCRFFLLGRLVNSTHILINGTLYRYWVLAYKPSCEDYVFLKELNLGAGMLITLIPPQKNITVTGGAGGTMWYNISVNGK